MPRRASASWTPNGHFTFANRRTADLLGHDVSTLVGKKASLLLGSDRDVAPVQLLVFRAPRSTRSPRVRPDGSEINLLVSTAPDPAGGQ